MLRILLIILVALAVIIGLMRLTGAKPGDAAPAGPVEEAVGEAVEEAPAEDVIVEVPAVDSLDAPSTADGDTTQEIVEPAVEAGEGAADEVLGTLEEVPAEPVTAAPDNAAPATDPAPAVETPPAADPDTPGL